MRYLIANIMATNRVLHEDGFCRDFMATTLDGRRAAVTAIFVGDYYQDTDGNPTAYGVFIMD